MLDDVPDFVASQALIPVTAPPPTWALVEIFGHRSHYGEIREVEAFGAKLLEVVDVDTGKTHRYGGAAIFSLTILSQPEMDGHVATIKRQKERDAEYEAKWRLRGEQEAAMVDNEPPF